MYCQASTDLDRHTKMTLETAERAVDIALQAPSHFLTFEFQGGEPLMNFETLRHIVEYTKAQQTDKEIEFSLVSSHGSHSNHNSHSSGSHSSGSTTTATVKLPKMQTPQSTPSMQ